jgi:exopolysaccharide biosynthesis predicted pyruvyltransferase EpsI
MTQEHPNPFAAIVNDLAARIDDALEPLLPRGTRCALLDFPNHSNVGDSAIWLGELEWLRRRGGEIVYACDTTTYSPRHLSDVIGSGPILLHGGGNLGDFWVEHQWFREQVIQAFPDNPIIQLPQTIHFQDEWGAAEAQRIFNAHPRLTVLCRDHPSLDFARNRFRATSELCPDMAFALGARSRTAPVEHDVIWLCRTDAEVHSAMASDLEGNPKRIDWLDESPTPAVVWDRELRQRLDRGRADSQTHRHLMVNYERLTRERVLRGCNLLSQAEVIVTDRLHGHILCLLLGIPHVLLDNVYGKIGAFHETWTRNVPLVHRAATPREALAEVDLLLTGRRSLIPRGQSATAPFG